MRKQENLFERYLILTRHAFAISISIRKYQVKYLHLVTSTTMFIFTTCDNNLISMPLFKVIQSCHVVWNGLSTESNLLPLITAEKCFYGNLQNLFKANLNFFITNQELKLWIGVHMNKESWLLGAVLMIAFSEYGTQRHLRKDRQSIPLVKLQISNILWVWIRF